MDSAVYVSLIGLLVCLFAFSGYEAGAHMAEETKHATKTAPMGIIYTCIATALTGWLFILGLLYAMNEDINDAVSGNSNQTVVNIYAIVFTKNGNLNKNAALAMTSLLIINLFFAGFSSLTVTSRIAFALVLDGGLPLSKRLYYVNKKRQTPNLVVLLVFVVDSVLCCFPLFRSTAFAAITTIGYQISYAIPIFLRLTVARRTFKKTECSLGALGEPIGWTAVV